VAVSEDEGVLAFYKVLRRYVELALAHLLWNRSSFDQAMVYINLARLFLIRWKWYGLEPDFHFYGDILACDKRKTALQTFSPSVSLLRLVPAIYEKLGNFTGGEVDSVSRQKSFKVIEFSNNVSVNLCAGRGLAQFVIRGATALTEQEQNEQCYRCNKPQSRPPEELPSSSKGKGSGASI
jgi:hypothetical protein